MTFMIEYGKILLISAFILIVNCNWNNDYSEKELHYKIANNIYMESYIGNNLDYTLKCERAIIDTNIMFMRNMSFTILNDSSTINIDADSAIKTDTFIKYYNNIRISINDSMELLTNCLLFNQLNDSVNTDDSVIIIKENNHLKTKGFKTDKYFNKIIFYNEIIIYGEEN